jgi:hypothetical protein
MSITKTKGFRAQSLAGHRWKCPHCGLSYWAKQPIPHDRADGRSCRPSGQKPERELKNANH